MTYETAKNIFESIGKTGHQDLFREMIRYAVQYARMRTDYWTADLEQKAGMEDKRSRAHDAFIDSCNILSRNMAMKGEDIAWREKLGTDRKSIGDFACYIHCILGIRAR